MYNINSLQAILLELILTVENTKVKVKLRQPTRSVLKQIKSSKQHQGREPNIQPTPPRTRTKYPAHTTKAAKRNIIYKSRPPHHDQPTERCSPTITHHRWSRARHTTSTAESRSKYIGNPACSEEVKQCRQLAKT